MALFIASGILILLGTVPGMPHFIFLTLGFAAGGLGIMLANRSGNATRQALIDNRRGEEDAKGKEEELGWDDVDQVDLVSSAISTELDLNILRLFDENINRC